MSPQWVRPPENNVRFDLRTPLRERVVRLLVEALEDDDPVVTIKIGASRIEVSW